MIKLKKTREEFLNAQSIYLSNSCRVAHFTCRTPDSPIAKDSPGHKNPQIIRSMPGTALPENDCKKIHYSLIRYAFYALFSFIYNFLHYFKI